MEGGRDETAIGSDSFRVSDLESKFAAVCHLALLNRQKTVRNASGFFAECRIHEKKESFVLTNHHFIRTKEESSNVTATFHFDGKKEAICIRLDPGAFFRTNEGFDYTMVGVRERDMCELSAKHGISPVELVRLPEVAKVGDQVYIAQHPEGKQLRFSTERIRKITATSVGYKADTDQGSSGSPVIFGRNGKLFVLALHKSGGVKLDDGELVNKGILITAILDHVNGHSGSCSSASPTSTVDESGEFVTGATNQGLPVRHPTVDSTSTDGPMINSESPEPYVKKPVPSDPPNSTTKPSQEIRSSSLHGPEQTPNTQGIQAQAVVQLCSKSFTTRELIRIAQRISFKWEEVAKCTDKFEDWEISNIRINRNFQDEVLKADRMLNDYKSRLGTRQVLAKALDLCKIPDVANIVRCGSFRDD